MCSIAPLKNVCVIGQRVKLPSLSSSCDGVSEGAPSRPALDHVDRYVRITPWYGVGSPHWALAQRCGAPQRYASAQCGSFVTHVFFSVNGLPCWVLFGKGFVSPILALSMVSIRTHCFAPGRTPLHPHRLPHGAVNTSCGSWDDGCLKSAAPFYIVCNYVFLFQLLIQISIECEGNIYNYIC